jgi:hypothetical protein
MQRENKDALLGLESRFGQQQAFRLLFTSPSPAGSSGGSRGKQNPQCRCGLASETSFYRWQPSDGDHSVHDLPIGV